MLQKVPIIVKSFEDSGPLWIKNTSKIGIKVALPTLPNAIYDNIGAKINMHFLIDR